MDIHNRLTNIIEALAYSDTGSENTRHVVRSLVNTTWSDYILHKMVRDNYYEYPIYK